jgi:cellulose synthase/poly-beta-1,6-N-acetylglucosamine synthase-like glycosyltransferase
VAIDAPSVTVLLPLLNEVESIDLCLESLVAQDYPGPIEILIAEGGSTDGTRERLSQWEALLPRLRVIENPRRLQSHGLNLLAEHAAGEVVVRADGHTTYAPDYVSRSVETLRRTGAMVVGGLMKPVGTNPFTKAVAAAMTSPWAIGTAKFRHADAEMEADAVYLGAMRRSDFLRVGGIRTFPTGVAEDADFFFRLSRAGARVVLDPLIVSSYQPRTDLPGLFRQFRRYGQGKAEMFWVNGELPSRRPLAPLALVIALAAGLALSMIGGKVLPLAVLVGVWLVGSLLVFRSHGRLALAVAAVAAVMQVAYGIGLVWGLVRGPGPVRDLRSPPVRSVVPPGRSTADQRDRHP